MLGRYIDALTDEHRDRIISAVNWRAGDAWPDQHGARCLVGHVELWDTGTGIGHDAVAARIRHLVQSTYRYPKTVPVRFDKLVARFGIARTVRLIKQRAGKHNRVTLDSAVAEHA